MTGNIVPAQLTYGTTLLDPAIEYFRPVFDEQVRAIDTVDIVEFTPVILAASCLSWLATIKMMQHINKVALDSLNAYYMLRGAGEFLGSFLCLSIFSSGIGLYFLPRYLILKISSVAFLILKGISVSIAWLHRTAVFTHLAVYRFFKAQTTTSNFDKLPLELFFNTLDQLSVKQTVKVLSAFPQTTLERYLKNNSKRVTRLLIAARGEFESLPPRWKVTLQSAFSVSLLRIS